MNNTSAKQHLMSKIAGFAVVFALFVVVLGAYTRLTNAGLGCPDWPGCYGFLMVPDQSLVNGSVVESSKAWTEMAHRYAAGMLSIFVFMLASMSIFLRRIPSMPTGLCLFLAGMIVFQAALGMWTVTWKLLPMVVMAHLLGGFTMLSGIFWLRLRLRHFNLRPLNDSNRRYIPWLKLAMLVAIAQIALGGWVSANYSGLACVGFPMCNGQWWPSMNMNEAFNLFSPIGANYEGGVLDSTSRVTIQWVHRIGAVATLLIVSSVAMWISATHSHVNIRRWAVLVLLCLLLQFCLGIANVLYFLPLWVAVAHNAVAAILLLSLFGLLFWLSRTPLVERQF